MHDHSHSGSPGARHIPRLRFVLVTTALVLVAQVVGAALSGSLALLADAGHALTDVAGLAVALVAVRLGMRAPTPRHSFGYQRFEVLAALVNAVLLIVVGVLVVVEALERWGSPPEVRADLMIWFASAGLVVNLVGLLVLRQGAKESINVRGAYLEVLGDMLGSLAVVLAGIVLATTGWQLADPVASLVIAALILPRAVALGRQVVHVLLEGTPDDVDLESVRRHIVGVDGVEGVHDLHVWQLTSGVPVMSAHVVVDDETLSACGREGILDRLAECLRDHFDVEHSTFQIESSSHADHEGTVHE